MRAKLRESQNKKGNQEGSRSTGDNASYPFWEIPFDTTAVVRFLPDADQDNVFFWVERQIIRLPFAGVVGGQYPTNKNVTVTVPCVDMFNMECPIIAAIRPLWKGTDEEVEVARTYYKKKSYICQGFVVDSPYKEETPPENPIRRFVINPSLIEIIKTGLMDPEMEDAPTDYLNGVDFKINKTQQGQYANYKTSSWSRRSRSLTEAEQAAKDQFGLWDLKQYRGQQPDKAGVEIIKAMFEASFAGQPFDHDSFGEHYRPYGDREDGDAATSAAKSALKTGSVAAPVRESAPAAPSQASAPASTGSASAHDILERIKNRTVNR